MMGPGAFGWLALGLLAFALATPDGQAAAKDLVAGITGRGKRVGTRTTINDAGFIDQDPEELASAAELELNTYALARMLSSEEGGASADIKRAIAWAARNHAGGTEHLAAILLAGKGNADGHFAKQSTDARYASTALDPYEDDVAIARAVVSSDGASDPTGGATNFYNPKLQDRLFAEGRVSKDAATVDAKWRSGGLEPIDVEGTNPETLRFYRKVT